MSPSIYQIGLESDSKDQRKQITHKTPKHLHFPEEQDTSISSISPTINSENHALVILNKSVIPGLRISHHGRHVGHRQRPVHDASSDIIGGNLWVDRVWATVSDAVTSNSRPVSVRLTVLIGKRQIGGTILGICRCDGCRHEAIGSVDDRALGRRTVDCVINFDTVEKSGGFGISPAGSGQSFTRKGLRLFGLTQWYSTASKRLRWRGKQGPG